MQIEENDDGELETNEHTRGGPARKRQKSSKPKFKHVLKLLHLAAEGKHHKLRKLLQRHPELNVNSYNSDGFTALHQAARFGHEEAIRVLLKSGADTKAEDFEGRTSAHLAAARGELGVLAVLLQETSELEMTNSASTQELKQLLHSALEERRFAEPSSAAELDHAEGSFPRALPVFESESEDDWNEKLRMNASMDDPYQDDILGSSSSVWESWDYDSFAQPDIGPEDEEAYAKKMWEDMQKRSHSQKRAGGATADTWAKADSAQERRRKAATDAAEHSRRILEEEQAKDRAWRQAVLEGDQGAKRAAYEAKWQSLVTMSGPVLHGDVPWLPENECGAQNLILYGVQSAAERKKRLRLELMRWHPDKFVAKFASRVIAKDKERVAEGVKRVSQMLNSLG